MPPLAVSSSPGLSRIAPVNAPFTWPNISDSSSVSGSAAQLIATSGRLERRLCWWMNWAMSSLPDPLSPVMNAEASVGATRRASAMTSRNTGAAPSTGSASLARSGKGCAPSARDSRPTTTACTARPMRISSWVAENALGR